MSGEHILIVDDEPAIQSALRGVLEDEGYRVTAVGSGAEAIGVVADEVAARLGLSPPPRVAVSQVAPEVAGMLTADRRIANRRLGELGVALRYPSWRDYLEAELLRLDT